MFQRKMGNVTGTARTFTVDGTETTFLAVKLIL